MVYFDTLGSLGNGSKVTDKGNLKTDINGSRDGPSIGDQTIQAALQFGVLVRSIQILFIEKQSHLKTQSSCCHTCVSI